MKNSKLYLGKQEKLKISKKKFQVSNNQKTKKQLKNEINDNKL